MKKITKQVFLTALTSVLATSVLAVTAPAAHAITPLACGNRTDLLKVTYHTSTHGKRDLCFANAGTATFGGDTWLHEIKTGNNRVQWFGDGKWQPAYIIDKWTTYSFPNHPGGVRMDKIWIE
ncbi:beta/gamma crystallin domain-containing protein [Streptosporangium sp. NPDC051022]|uniref:beta/gamma crystallin domain-containing protein n=1 Tax=Streptosporangium sp. NPDC051022 TaxID=3155752 RepID=UPI00343B687D